MTEAARGARGVGKERAALPRRGRPTLCTPQITGAIYELIRAGAYPQIAATVNGVGHTAFFNWLGRGRTAIRRELEGFDVPPADLPFVEFVEAVEKAQAEVEARATMHALRATEGSATAALAFLERRFGARWAPHNPIDDLPGPSTPAGSLDGSGPGSSGAGASPSSSWRQSAGLSEDRGVGPVLPENSARSKRKADASGREIERRGLGRATSRHHHPVRGPAGGSKKSPPTPLIPRVAPRVEPQPPSSTGSA